MPNVAGAVTPFWVKARQRAVGTVNVVADPVVAIDCTGAPSLARKRSTSTSLPASGAGCSAAISVGRAGLQPLAASPSFTWPLGAVPVAS